LPGMLRKHGGPPSEDAELPFFPVFSKKWLKTSLNV
jgi:hypothetical protein